MLSLVELRRLFDLHGTPPGGRALIEEARRNAPVRKVRSNSNNVITRFSSRKMSRFIDTESRTVEYPAVVMYEHDDKVLEYYAQPVKLDLKWQAPSAKKPFRTPHTPDMLLIREDGFWIEEWKEERKLLDLHEKNPERFFKENGEWRYPAAEEKLRDLGISYRIRTADEHPRTYIQNLTFLSDYLDTRWPSVEDEHLEAIHAQFQGQAAIPLLHLIERGKATTSDVGEEILYTSDEIYKAIADGALSFDLMGDLLSDTHRAMVYRDSKALELGRSIIDVEVVEEPPVNRRDVSVDPGCQVDWDGVTYAVVRVGTKTATLESQGQTFDHEVTALVEKHQRGVLTVHSINTVPSRTLASFEKLSPARVEEILKRKAILDQVDQGLVPLGVSDRTIRRYRAMVRNAGEHPVDQRLALASQVSNRGYRDRRLADRVIELVAEVARDHYNDPRNMNKTTAYKYFVLACERENQTPCSMNSFNKELDRHKSVKSRMGKRMAYQNEPTVWYLKITEPVHGTRPFQYVHIDHTQLDLQLVGSESRKNLGKPWLSIAIDAESRAILGFYVTLEAPSYRSCMMVIRDLVRRHGQMPAMLVLDNGKEFHSRALTRLCELYGCSIRYRPGGKPQYGSVIERIFGITNTMFIHALEGNTQLMKNPRSLTKSVLPENFAAWNLTQLHGALDVFFFSLYGKSEHPAHGNTPDEYFKRRLTETGERQHRLVRFDDLFRIETCPPPYDRPTRVVDRKRGIKIRNLYFWNEVFLRPDLNNKELEVRMDPWDPGTAFVLAKGQWVACVSKIQPMLSKYTELERRYLFEEIAKRSGTRVGSLSPHRLREWVSILDPKNFNPELSERQEQGKALYGALGMTKAMPTLPPPKPEPEPPAVVRLKVSKPVATTKSDEKAKERRPAAPQEEEFDDYSLL